MTQRRAAIIGCGPATPGMGGAHSFAYAHGWAFRNCGEIDLVAAATRTPKNLADFCAEFPGCRGYQDYRAMLETERPELVSVCAYAPDRVPMVRAALEAGARGVWVEKPFALSLADARAMMDAAGERGARLFVGHQRRYGQPFLWAQEAAATKIGVIQDVLVTQTFPTIFDFGAHLIDSALFCLGERRATRVLAAVDAGDMKEHQGMLIERHSVATVHFNDGVRMLCESGSFAKNLAPVLRINGSDGFVEIHLDVPAGAQSVFRARYAGEAALISPPTNEHFHHSEDPVLYMTRAAADVARALRTGAPTPIDVEHGFRTLEILLAIFESGRLGQIVTLPLAQQDAPLALRRAQAPV